MIITVGRSGFERLLSRLRRREEVRAATRGNQVQFLQRVNKDCRSSHATIGKRPRCIGRNFPNSLLSSEIRLIAGHNSDAFREEGIAEIAIRPITILKELLSKRVTDSESM
ncbi:MAG TPA: hypothetical protein PKE16_15325 [Hyphomicrobium sp.]|nr:hypothetical protein [Hyphomicrobium sp.]